MLQSTVIPVSLELLSDHPINRRRRDEGKPAANMIWPWGQGLAVSVPSFFAQNSDHRRGGGRR